MHIRLENNITTMTPAPYMDINFVDTLRNAINKTIKENSSHIILDLHDVVSINSSCLGVIIETMSRVKDTSREIVMCEMQDIIKKIILVLNLQKIFIILDTYTEAVEYLRNKRNDS